MARMTPMILVAGTLLLAACGSATPQEQLNDINALVAKGFPMNEEQRSQLATLVAEGTKALASGDTDTAGKAFDQALKLLKTAEDAAMFNKSE